MHDPKKEKEKIGPLVYVPARVLRPPPLGFTRGKYSFLAERVVGHTFATPAKNKGVNCHPVGWGSAVGLGLGWVVESTVRGEGKHRKTSTKPSMASVGFPTFPGCFP